MILRIGGGGSNNFRFAFDPEISRIQSKGTAVKAQASFRAARSRPPGLLLGAASRTLWAHTFLMDSADPHPSRSTKLAMDRQPDRWIPRREFMISGFFLDSPQ
jgi:hypothetical protein